MKHWMYVILMAITFVGIPIGAKAQHLSAQDLSTTLKALEKVVTPSTMADALVMDKKLVLFLKTPAQDKWELSIKLLPNIDEAKRDFKRTVSLAAVPAREITSGLGDQVEGGPRPKLRGGHLTFQQGPIVVNMSSDFDWPELLEKARTLSDLLRTNDIQKNISTLVATRREVAK